MEVPLNHTAEWSPWAQDFTEASDPGRGKGREEGPEGECGWRTTGRTEKPVWPELGEWVGNGDTVMRCPYCPFGGCGALFWVRRKTPWRVLNLIMVVICHKLASFPILFYIFRFFSVSLGRDTIHTLWVMCYPITLPSIE